MRFHEVSCVREFHMKRLVSTLLIALWATAATAGSPPITHADVDRWAQAWNSHDIDRVMALFAPTVQIDQPENPKPLDYAGTRAFFGMIFRAYPDFHVQVKQAVVEGLSAVSVEQVTGTWSGPFVDPATGKATPGNGRAFGGDAHNLHAGPQDHPRVHLLGSVDGRSSAGHHAEVEDVAGAWTPHAAHGVGLLRKLQQPCAG
jgi:hypothetical protein